MTDEMAIRESLWRALGALQRRDWRELSKLLKVADDPGFEDGVARKGWVGVGRETTPGPATSPQPRETLTITNWIGARYIGSGWSVSPRPGPTGYQWHAWGPLGGNYGAAPTRQDAERAARQARATLCRKVGR